MRLMVSGSAALPVPVLDRWRKISGHTLLERYGMTETGMVLTNPYEPASNRIPSYVGKPFPGIDVAILDDNGDIHRDDSTEGELIIKSPSLFDRYLDNPEATEATFLDWEGEKWFKTGDCAVYHSDVDSYKILGRLSADIIKKSGYKISALEIEDVLLQHEAVSEVAVVGMPDEERGEEIVAFVVLTKKVSEKVLLDHCIEKMSNYKVPRVWKFVDSLPRNAMGKVSKKDLKTIV